MKIKKLLTGLILIILISGQIFGQSQGVSITVDNSPPDESAMLDIVHSNKGILIPRVNIQNLEDNTAPINNPTVSLLVYNTNPTTGEGYYYWSKDDKWEKLIVNSELVDNDVTNEIQDISLDGNNLSISNGSTIDISTVKPQREIAIYEDKKLVSENSGDAIAGGQIRDLTNTVFDNSSNIELIGNIIRLQPGTYLVNASAPAYNTGNHQLNLTKENDGSVVIFGTTEYCDNNATRSFLNGIISINSVAEVNLTHWMHSPQATNGLGVSTGVNYCVYTTITIEKLD